MNNKIKRTLLREFNLSFIDTETTGLKLNHELIEIAVIRVSAKNFKILEEWEIKIKPLHLELADPKALKINHYNKKEWQKAVDLEKALKIFLEKTANTILVGHNLAFDWFYIHKALSECTLKPTFYYKGLDTFSFSWQRFHRLSNFQGLSLSEMADYFGIKQKKAHSALDDAITTYKVFLKLIEYK